MMMSQTNGDGRFGLPQTAQIYAALAVCEDTQVASQVLQAQGVAISPRRLSYYQRNGGERLRQMKESGLAAQLIGQQARQMSRVKRLDVFTEWLEQQFMNPEALDALSKELASLVHRYRETMQLVMDHDSPDGEREADEETPLEDQQRVQGSLSLLELITNGQHPDETFAELVFDAARRVAAASGATFRPPGPAMPTLAEPT